MRDGCGATNARDLGASLTMRLGAPPYVYAAGTAIIIAVIAVIAVAVWTPADVHAMAVRVDIALAWAYAASVLFAAAPFAVGGSIAAHAARCVRVPPPVLAALALACPACECSGGALSELFARARLTPGVATACMTWAALCNLPALAASWSAGGTHAAVARGLAGAVSALVAALSMCGARAASARACRIAVGARACDALAGALGGVALTAIICAAVGAWWPQVRGIASQPLSAGLAGALLAPCSAADLVLARSLARTHAGEMIFVVAAQTLSARHLAAMWRAFGPRGVVAAVAGAACGAAVGALASR